MPRQPLSESIDFLLSLALAQNRVLAFNLPRSLATDLEFVLLAQLSQELAACRIIPGQENHK
jgi:hypothetical protein